MRKATRERYIGVIHSTERVMGGSPRAVAVTVGVKDRLQLLFQQPRGRSLRDSVCRVGHTEDADP